jgi:serine/threonine-protein kinase RsbW
VGTQMELVIPADHPHVRVARLTATGLGSLLGFDVESLDEMRLVIDEMCSVLLECSSPPADQPDRLAVVFRRAGPALRIRVERSHAEVVAAPSAISRAILDALCDRWAFMQGAIVVADVPLARHTGDATGNTATGEV